jgi:hypothetical protein
LGLVGDNHENTSSERMISDVIQNLLTCPTH